MARFDLSRSPVDGKWRRYERRMASSLSDLSTGGPLLDPEELDMGVVRDYPVWVCTGVFKRRKDVFKR